LSSEKKVVFTDAGLVYSPFNLIEVRLICDFCEGKDHSDIGIVVLEFSDQIDTHIHAIEVDSILKNDPVSIRHDERAMSMNELAHFGFVGCPDPVCVLQRRWNESVLDNRSLSIDGETSLTKLIRQVISHEHELVHLLDETRQDPSF